MKKGFCFVAMSLILAGCGEESKTVSYETNVVSEDSSSSLQESSSSSEPLSSSEAVASSSSSSEGISYGELLDSRNHKTYKTVVIGKGESAQEWMAENLNIKEVNQYGFCYEPALLLRPLWNAVPVGDREKNVPRRLAPAE